MKYSEKDKAEALQAINKLVKPGDTLFTVLRHVSRSGMQREISVFAVKAGGVPICLDRHICRIHDDKIGKHGGIVIGGCGMDMGFELVYRLGETLWTNGTKQPHGTRNGKPDSDGGYALKQSWM